MTYVRMGDVVHSPIIEEGGADYMLSFEKLEALRYIQLMKKRGSIVVNTQRIDPMPVITGIAQYPEDISEKLNRKIDAFEIDAMHIAKELGNIRVVNTLMIGKLAKMVGGEKDTWIKALTSCVPEKTIDINIAAFNRGYDL